MPTYQYRCLDCDGLLEVVQSFTDDALTDCPSCNGSLRKVYNSVGVVFKGSGFYRTDSRDTSSSSTAPAKGDASPSKPETPAKTESTAAAATPAPAAK